MTEFKIPVSDVGQLRLKVEIYTPNMQRSMLAQAIIDTGASMISINDRVIRELQLQPLAADPNRDQARGIGGTVTARRYPIALRLISAARDHADMGSSRVLHVEASASLKGESSLDMLLGMNALMQYRSVHLNGRMCILDDSTRLEHP